MEAWMTKLWLKPGVVKLLVRSTEGHDILKAHLPGYPDHPRALLTLLEGLALWNGKPLCAAIAAAVPVSHSLGLGPFGDEWPATSALVSFDFIGPQPRGHRIRASFGPLFTAAPARREP